MFLASLDCCVLLLSQMQIIKTMVITMSQDAGVVDATLSIGGDVYAPIICNETPIDYSTRFEELCIIIIKCNQYQFWICLWHPHYCLLLCRWCDDCNISNYLCHQCNISQHNWCNRGRRPLLRAQCKVAPMEHAACFSSENVPQPEERAAQKSA